MAELRNQQKEDNKKKMKGIGKKAAEMRKAAVERLASYIYDQYSF